MTVHNWELIKSVINTGMLVFQIIMLGIFLYYLVISAFGWFKRKEARAENYPVKNTFAFIVAAHNEERVIRSIVQNLKQINYPKHMYDIFVIADNCDDNTARFARESGAIVCERFDTIKKGKGHSLEWMFGKLFKMDKQYDAVCILDADNLVSSNFLMEMNKQLCLGNKVVQGYLDSKNPRDSWVSGNCSISYWIANRLFQLPRHYLGLNCALGGTGFIMATDVLKQIGWGATCLTEDLEFSVKLVLNGMHVSWAHEAKVYDEKPLGMKQSWGQRKRWMQGHCDCAVRYFKSLFIKAAKEKDKVAFDCALYLIQPIVIIVNVFLSILMFCKTFVFGHHSARSIHLSYSDVIFAVVIPVLMYFTVIFVYVEGKMSKKIFKYFIVSPIFSLTWVPIIIQGFFTRNNKVWVHTIHTRAIDINEIEAMEKAG
jgi:cellulose synthase/poly-beta-1,6-N-acetylglucosamine synthase-like glycosyltransferase